jgi:adenine-specific DNA-methyltransferase
LGGALDRNKLGQYFTPDSVAKEMVRYALELMPPSQEIRFLEPGFGHGAFYKALIHSVPGARLNKAWGYEINLGYVEDMNEACSDGILDLRLADFTTAFLPNSEKKVNLLLCNPPYVRHHHLSPSNKKLLSENVQKATGISLNGRAGLYCYFILVAHSWLAPDAISGWLLPSEFMDTDYGKAIREYLTANVLLLRIHRFKSNESLFDDAIVSSTIVFFYNRIPAEDHELALSSGDSLLTPTITSRLKISQLKKAKKWSSLLIDNDQAKFSLIGSERQPQFKLSDFFEIKRGIATGANSFFIISTDKINFYQLPGDFLKPILPSSRFLDGDEIDADEDGEPHFEHRLYLLDCKLPEEKLRNEHPQLWQYLETGKKAGVHLHNLCQSRTPWYSQESRLPAPIICKYMGNTSRPGSKPIRFILNHSQAIATNAYHLLYPRPSLQSLLDADPNLIQVVWQILNKIAVDLFIVEGRTYGGGLFKIEPGELGRIPVGNLTDLLNREQSKNG